MLHNKHQKLQHGKQIVTRRTIYLQPPDNLNHLAPNPPPSLFIKKRINKHDFYQILCMFINPIL